MKAPWQEIEAPFFKTIKHETEGSVNQDKIFLFKKKKKIRKE